jgi:hypothetical protein
MIDMRKSMAVAVALGVALARPVAAAELEPEGPQPDSAAELTDAKALRRTAIGELTAGSVLTATGMFGVMWMSFGAHLTRMADRELAKGAGLPESTLAPLQAQREQGQTLIGAGAVIGVLGFGIGLALVGVGARDLKASRKAKLQVRLAPSPGGAMLVGRF